MRRATGEPDGGIRRQRGLRRGSLEGGELRSFLMKLDEFEQIFHSSSGACATAAWWKFWRDAELQIDSKADFAERANLKPYLEALSKAGSIRKCAR